MISYKRLSLSLLLVPALFIGCTSEKISSLQPSKEKKIDSNNTQQITLEQNKSLSKKEKLLASAIFGGEISLTNSNIQDDTFVNNSKFKKLTTQKLKLSNKSEIVNKEEEILETAKQFLGVKYIWAANGPSAFDCSGFTKYVFKENGISLPRHSGHQANVGQKIKFNDLEKGDLVFFDTEKKFTHRVNHVGIFIGDNKFIHASSAKKKVIITSFSKKKFYKNKFLYARRIINSNDNIALHHPKKGNSTFN